MEMPDLVYPPIQVSVHFYMAYVTSFTRIFSC